MTRCVIWGAGELGGRVGRLAIGEGYDVHAYTATTSRHSDLQSAGIKTSVGDPPPFEPTDLVLLSIAGTDSLHEAIKRVVAHAPPKRIILTSSTGYYHSRAGIIDAESEAGESPRAQKIAAMETAFQLWAKDAGVILRLGGLYRIGRGPMSAYQKKKNIPPGPPNKVLALIHYDDAAQATFAAMTRADPKPHYIVVSSVCPTRQEFYLAASVLLGLPIPSFGKPMLGPPMDYDTQHMELDLLPAPSHPRWQTALVPA
ncbi:MAG: hypothetical protein CMH52_12765 [Myxococcales bacterium]|nr:hypothetical protein [Myxococcales bacterium]|tara:strand:- start:689 stop:1459 length:771 start_codon:yes stop_codon:yes gene_type:complete